MSTNTTYEFSFTDGPAPGADQRYVQFRVQGDVDRALNNDEMIDVLDELTHYNVKSVIYGRGGVFRVEWPDTEISFRELIGQSEAFNYVA